ncbi:MAG: hypothetical protein LBV41_03560 [Cytophagaceae bacterium]|jgi:hypothetical protein|nr:hypothetical protein [Cytophagaceae bacterium]
MKLSKRILIPCLLTIIGFTGCTFEEEAVDIRTYTFTVRRSDWRWNRYSNRFDYLCNFPELTGNIYNHGIIDAKVYIMEGTTETLKPLPYVQTYLDENYVYTETISYDVSPGEIMFTVQASDLSNSDAYLQTLDFKISLMIDSY